MLAYLDRTLGFVSSGSLCSGRGALGLLDTQLGDGLAGLPAADRPASVAMVAAKMNLICEVISQPRKTLRGYRPEPAGMSAPPTTY